MLDEINKSYWTKVYVTYGTNLSEWYTEKIPHPLSVEYTTPEIESTYTLQRMGYLDKTRYNFTQKFIDEVIMEMTENEIYEYWKKVYLTFGDNFDIMNLREIYGNFCIYNSWGYYKANVHYYVLVTENMRGKKFGRFTKKFWDKLNGEKYE